MAVSSEQLNVDIDGQQYSLVEIPPETSAIVRMKQSDLLGAIDLKSLVDDLGRVGRFVRIAYNGVAAAGPQFTELQIQVQRLGFDITKLCDKSAVTVAKFKSASGSILVDLQATYQYLMDSLEEIGVETLAAVSTIAGEMAQAAQELHDDFEKQADKVEATLEETERHQGHQAIQIEEKKKERVRLQIEQKQQEQLISEVKQAEEAAESSYHQYEANEDEAIRKIEDPSLIKGLINAFTTKVLGLGPVLGNETGAAEKRAELFKQKKLEALGKANELRERRHQALEKFSAFTVKIGECETEQQMAAAAVDALHEAMRGLRELAAIMLQATLFWKQMQNHCLSLAHGELQRNVETALEKYSEEKRLKMWTSTSFKKQAVHFYAGWVALHSVCTAYVEQIKHTQKDLYKYIKENPTYEESRRRLPDLVAEFKEDLAGAQKAIAEQTFQAEEEMKALLSSEGQ